MRPSDRKRAVAAALSVTAGLAGLAGLAGCGSGGPTAGGSTRGGSAAARTATIPSGAVPLSPVPPPGLGRPATPSGPPIGTAQHTVSLGAHLTVSVQRLIDPLSRSGASLLPGTRAVAIIVTLTNAGPALYDSSATGDFSLVPSTGTVTPVFVPQGACETPVDDFDRYMTAGAVRSGCVAFSLAARARVESVRFSPHDGAAGRLTWSPKR